MPKPNTSGTTNPDDYNLGRGTVYISELVNDLPKAWRDLGNCSEFNVALETETLEHKSSRSGLAVVDKEVILSQKMSLSFKLDEINAENVSLFFSGEQGTYVNPAVAGVAEIVDWITDVELGRWYDLTAATTAGTPSGTRLRGIDSNAVTLEKNDAVDVLLVEGTDYTLDHKNGRVFFKPTAVNIAAGDDVNFTYAADADAPTPINEIKGQTQTNVQVAVKFIAQNPANNDEEAEYQFHKVTLKPDGDFPLIGEDWTTMGFSGVAEANETADADSPYCTVRTDSES
jgi:plastocyanin